MTIRADILENFDILFERIDEYKKNYSFVPYVAMHRKTKRYILNRLKQKDTLYTIENYYGCEVCINDEIKYGTVEIR